jgi:hypothetical protein
VLICAVAVALLGAGSFSSADPYQIYDRARAVWRAQTYPDELTFKTTVHVLEGAKDEWSHYNGEASTANGIRVDGVSEEEQAAPHDARGTNFKIAIDFSWNQNAGGNVGHWVQDAHRKESSPDYLGVPLISPEYSFGLEPAQQLAPISQPSVNPLESALPTIAIVRSNDRAYAIALVGTEPVGGFLAYHLRLQPHRDPAKYRLRELWVDVYTYGVLKLVTQGNFTGAPMNAVPWDVTFQNVGGATYIQTETAEAPLVFRGDRTFTSAAITFSDIKIADSRLPALPFMDSGQILKEP